MNNSISIMFGKATHGWLPVDLRYEDFALDFEASDVLNDPIEELYNVIVNLQNNECKQVIWWCEPGAYFFDFEKKEQAAILTIKETDDIHNKNADIILITVISGNNKQILEPFRLALVQFTRQTYEERHWPYYLDESKIDLLQHKRY